MSLDERSAEAWLARGIEAYQGERFAEAVEHFKKAVATDSGSVEAHLALGATYLTLYKRRPSPPSPDYIRAERDISETELKAYREQERAILAEQNSTNWPLAEESLKEANRLDPQNKLVMEYLCALYFAWRDPLDEEKNRAEEEKQWFDRLAEVYPEHKYANFHCGLIASTQARKLLPNYGRLPPVPEPDLASLRTKVATLLEEAKRHLSRALILDPEHTGALHFLDEVRSMEAYLADPDQAARDLRDKLQRQFIAAQRRAAADPGQSSLSATITFEPDPEAFAEARARPFPPDPWWI
jgi:tetratricopeptide (TPR) repeat protein